MSEDTNPDNVIPFGKPEEEAEVDPTWTCVNCQTENTNTHGECTRCGYAPSKQQPLTNNPPCNFCGLVQQMTVTAPDGSATICSDCVHKSTKLFLNAAKDILRRLPPPVPINKSTIIIPGQEG